MSTKDNIWDLSWVGIVSGFIIGAVIASAIAAAMASQTPLGIEDLPSIVMWIVIFGMFSGGLAQAGGWMLRWLRLCLSRNVDSTDNEPMKRLEERKKRK